MRKVILLLSFVSLFWACQKKEYPTFNYSQSAYMHQPKVESVAPTDPVTTPTVTAPQPLLASSGEDLSMMTEKEVSLATILAEAISSPSEEATVVTTYKAAPAKMTWTQKVIAKKIQKQIKKADSPEKVNKAKAGTPDTLALLSLIFGGVGLLLLFAGGGLALLLGVAGLVLGIISLGRIKKGETPASAKTMALLGTIFGGVVALLGLIAIAAYSSIY